jgi:phosphonate transport system substrate-binding protein
MLPMTARMTRRALLGSLLAAGGLVVVACGGAAPAATPAPPSTAAQAITSPTTVPVTASVQPTVAAKPMTGAPFALGFTPGEDAEEVLKRYQPIVAYLRTAMDSEIRGFVGTDYSATIEALKARKVDAAFMGPFAYVLAAEVAGAKVIVMRGNPDGSPGTYKSLIIAGKKTGITTLADLKGRTFAFVDPASASGHLVPRATLVKNSIDPEKDMKATFAGGHDAVALAVNGGKVDAGAVADSILPRLVERKLVDEANYGIIAYSNPIPSSPFAVRADLDPALRDKLKAALLRLYQEVPAELVRALLGNEQNRYVVAEDRVFDPLRETAKVLKLDLTKMKE